MKITKSLIGVALATSLSFGSGIPVVDAAANAQMIKDSIEQALTWAEEAKRWSDTVQQYKADLEAQAREFATKTGIRDAVKFAKDINSVYESAKGLSTEVVDAVKNFDLNELDNRAYDLLTKAIGDDPCKSYDTLEGSNTCKKIKVAPWKDTVAISESMKKYEDLSKKISDLGKYIEEDKGDKEDIKTSADIANQINLVAVQMQAEKARIELQLASLQRAKEAAERAETERLKKARRKAPFQY